MTNETLAFGFFKYCSWVNGPITLFENFPENTIGYDFNHIWWRSRNQICSVISDYYQIFNNEIAHLSQGKLSTVDVCSSWQSK